ncbi:hypothetical protein [Subtercola endophyticus]|uniref:hypothetical protein n=1 Tax=Subtercola endophyticus TaxID=2895559 RepID=UPI001E59597A|nr:hypothetical protein [Subtercola endophyticus]UFS59888.1 hypothetical protein LQ955_03595 [Subtercola endophyticus]
MGDVTCLVIGCTAEPDDEITVEVNGLSLVYSVCLAHATEMRWGATYSEYRSDQHGLLGLRQSR